MTSKESWRARANFSRSLSLAQRTQPCGTSRATMSSAGRTSTAGALLAAAAPPAPADASRQSAPLAPRAAAAVTRSGLLHQGRIPHVLPPRELRVSQAAVPPRRNQLRPPSRRSKPATYAVALLAGVHQFHPRRRIRYRYGNLPVSLRAANVALGATLASESARPASGGGRRAAGSGP